MNVLGGAQEGEMQRDESLYVLHICKVVIRRNYTGLDNQTFSA